MSFPLSAFADQAREIKSIIALYQIETRVARETNKGVILCVLTKQDADELKKAFIKAGFFTTYSKGLTSTLRYISISYRYPTGY